MIRRTLWARPVIPAAVFAVLATGASATTLDITVTNALSGDTFAFTPFYVAFHDGAFDAFSPGDPASAGVELIAELGDVSGLPPERLAASPGSVATVVTAPDIGPPTLEPGESGTARITLDNTAEQRFLTYLSMLVPTNDTFVGNGDPTALEIFDDTGAYLGDQTFEVTNLTTYDAGTEVNDPVDGPAFVPGIDATLGTDEGGVVTLAQDQSDFAGVMAANGIVLDADLIDLFPAEGVGIQTIATISITEVAPIPVPAMLPVFAGALGLMAFGGYRRRRATT